MAWNSAAILSKRTCVAQHPYVTDVDAEMEQIEKEQQEAIEQYGNAFMQKQEDGDDVNGEDE